MKTYKLLLHTILLFSLFAASTSAEIRTFTDQKGQTLQGELIADKGDKVTLRLTNGIKHDIPINRFSSQDQDYIKKWIQANANKAKLTTDSKLTIEVKLKRKKDDIYKSSYSDNATENFEPSVRITNDELATDFKNAKVTLIVLGESPKKDKAIKILSKQSFSFDLEASQDFEWQGKPFSSQYYKSEYSGSNYARGYKYKGFVYIVQNKNGEIVKTKATRKNWLNSMIDPLDWKEKTVYDRDLRVELEDHY